MTENSELLLYGVFRKIIEHRVPLGVADYLDAIRALRMQSADPAVQPPSRDLLKRLCHIVWARSAEESRLIDAVFALVPPPAPEEVATLSELVDALLQGAPSPDPTERRLERGGHQRIQEQTTSSSTVAGRIAVEFDTRGHADGIPLPYPVLPAASNERYVMDPQTVVSPRALAVLWRRYRRMIRSGKPTELDVDGTIDAKCRVGTVDRPVLRPARMNRARLVILADVSPSMAPWSPFLDALADSLRFSRLSEARVLYFSNVPARACFSSPELRGAVPVETVLAACKGAGLLIVSDGGAARGFLRQRRVADTTRFLEVARRHARVVWLNPMPQARWKDTSAAAIASSQRASFLPLSVAALIRGVDILRGAKSR